MVDAAAIAPRLLAWYDASARDLPWRVGPRARAAGERPDPYRVWLSEIMLQQTTVAAVAPRFQRFTERWPTVEALADASLDDVLAEWAGLGYYARARNLHRCALAVVETHGGRFPDAEEALRALPGIGAYTAGAIAAIAFDQPASAPDGNVERVMARLYAVETPLSAAKKELHALAARHVPRERPGDYAQALMDLGATVCTPKSPSCLLCPLIDLCGARSRGIEADLPRKARKTAKPVRRGVAFLLERPGGEVLLERRPSTVMLGGLLGLPGTPWWDKAGWEAAYAAPLAHAPATARWRDAGAVSHVFTHFALELDIRRAAADVAPRDDRLWLDPDPDDLPTLYKKALAAAGGN